jgi:hypothetical protein
MKTGDRLAACRTFSKERNYKMNNLHRSLSLFAVFVGLLLAVSVRAGDDAWKPVSPAELAQKTPVVEKDADAEAIFWEVRADDKSDDEVVFKHYLRIKIFNERGREKFSKLDFPQAKGFKVKDIAVRITKPDGTFTELTKNDFNERTVVKANGLKIKVTSLAVPSLDPGAILEYRYKQVIEDASIGKLDFQRDIPIQTVTYYVRPHKNLFAQYRKYNLPPDVGLVKEKDGFSRATMTNVPAFREEPYMPPEDEVRPWMFFYYGFGGSTGRYAIWAGALESFLKKSDEANKLAPQLVASAATPEEKLQRIYEFCQTQIRNLTFDSKLTDEDRKKFKENKNANDVLKNKAGNWLDINGLFIALTRAVGFSSYLALPGDRSERFYTQSNVSETVLRPTLVAVNMGKTWAFYDPSTPYLPPGALPWYREGALTYVARDFGSWTETPVSGPEQALTKRTGRFKLSPDGTLEGEVRVELSGHEAYRERVVHGEDSPEQREKELREDLSKRLSVAEPSNFKIEPPKASNQPSVHSYRVRAPGYAQVVGKRIFFQPNYFTYGEKPIFTSHERQYGVYFSYAWSEKDDIEIELPAGFELDNADAPVVVSSGQILENKVILGIDRAANKLVYNRRFLFGGKSILLFDVSQYPTLKILFERVNKCDTHTLAIKQKGETATKPTT